MNFEPTNFFAGFGMGATFGGLTAIIISCLCWRRWARLELERRMDVRIAETVSNETKPGGSLHAGVALMNERMARDGEGKTLAGAKWRFQGQPGPGPFPGTREPVPVELAIFVFDPIRGCEADPAWRGNRRELIDYKAALRLLCAKYVTEDTGIQVQKLTDLKNWKIAYLNAIGGMIERPLRMGESSPARPLPPPGRDSLSPLRNHPELADDPIYVRDCIANPMQAEDYAARTGQIPELFEFRAAPDSRGRLVTRKDAELMTEKHFPGHGTEILASLSRGATSSINVSIGVITRFKPEKAR